MSQGEVSIGELRARAGAIVDECARSKLSVIVTRRGHPVAILVPWEDAADGLESGFGQTQTTSKGWGDWQGSDEGGASTFSQDLDSLTWGRMDELSAEDRAAAVRALELARRGKA